MKVALIGNPNIGKSTLFNRLTGLSQRIGNYTGTTVEKREGSLEIEDEKIRLYDLPGTYTIYPKSKDEEIVYDVLGNPQHPDYPDKIVVMGHPLQLKRSLLLYFQVLDLGLPTVFVLNMMDEVDETKVTIDYQALQQAIGSELVLMSAKKGEGIADLKQAITKDLKVADKKFSTPLLYKKACAQISQQFDCASEYIAWQFLAQPSPKHLSAKELVELAQIKKEHRIVSERCQISETLERYQYIDRIIAQTVKRTEETQDSLTNKLDKILMHPIWGYVIFFGLLLLIFQAIYNWSAVPMDFIDGSFGDLQTFLQEKLGDSPLASLLVNGIVPGIGGVVIFVPQIVILIFFLMLLEESGYISRVVFLMDKWMRPFGLNGKSVVPLISGVACAIPGIMAARNIENNKERMISILVTPFVTCAARLPVYAILIALVIPEITFFGFNLQGLTLMALYLLGFVAAFIFAYVFKKNMKSDYKSYLIMELPKYQIPAPRNLLLGLWEKVSAFIFGAGKIILAVSIVIWVLSSFGFGEKFNNAEQIIGEQAVENQWTQAEQDHHLESFKLEHSLLGDFGKTVQPVFAPMGYDWKISIGVLSSFAAREVFVGTMASIYSIGSDSEDENKIMERMRKEKRSDGTPVFSLATGLSLLIFYAFAMQCMSTMAVVHSETRSWKWVAIQWVAMSGTAYVLATLVYQLLK